jgi:hypothetical protein
MTEFVEDLWSKLSAPFPPEVVSWRVGSTTGDKKKGLALAYIDARDVMQRLDTLVGPENWQNKYSHANGKTVCDIGIRCGQEWVWKADGAGDSDIEAEKGALSDAFKRAAVRWGIGRYLYSIESIWVELNERKQIQDSELPKLRRLLAGEKASKKDVKQPGDGITKLKEELKAFDKDLASCGDSSSLEGCVSANLALIGRCKKELPDWWDHPSGRGIGNTIDRMRRQFSGIKAGTMNPHVEFGANDGR